VREGARIENVVKNGCLVATLCVLQRSGEVVEAEDDAGGY
jgi:hypothetical protein